MIIKSKKIIITYITIIIFILGLSVTFISLFDSITTYNSNGKKPIYYVKTNEKKIAITIDTTWGEDNVKEMLDVFDKYNVKATFFVIGKWMDQYKDEAMEISKRGHELGNHSDYHKDFTKIPKNDIIKEITDCDSKIKEVTGNTPKLLRAPKGAYNDLVVNTAEETGHYLIQWDVDSIDWKNVGLEEEYKRVRSRCKEGSILLFHTGTKYTVKNLDRLIGELTKEGYQFVTVSDLIYKKDYKIENDGGQTVKQ